MRGLVTIPSIGFVTLSFIELMMLAACNTTVEAGKDISKAGHAITNSAQEYSY